MARPLGVEFEGAIYHAMKRGERREPIFREDRVKGSVPAIGSELFRGDHKGVSPYF